MTSLRTRRAAERERVRRERAAARRVHVHAGDVEGVGGLFLQLVVVDHGVVAEPRPRSPRW